MRFSCLSLFPEMIEASLHSSILKRALERGLIDYAGWQIRDFAVNDYGQVDDKVFGGGTGMLLMAEPIDETLQKACSAYRERYGKPREERRIYLSPRGPVLTQSMAQNLSQAEHLILLCGHYEGVDQRVLDKDDFQELSIGNYVLTGGELAAAVLIDVIARMIPGVLPNAEAWQQESIASGLLEPPQYTRPAVWQGREVPPVLLSGHAANITAWRRREALRLTLERRPDLIPEGLSEADWALLLERA